MPLRSSLTKLLGSFSLRLDSSAETPPRRGRPRSAWATAAAGIGLFATSATGCGGCDDGMMVHCDTAEQGCYVCDAYGCRPGTQVGMGGAGGATSVTTSGVGGSGGMGGAGGSTASSDAAACDPAVSACACKATSDCGTDKACIHGLCISACTFSYECGAGRVCVDGACTAACDATTPCDAGYTCASGACVVDPTHPACNSAKPCATGEICVGGLCTSNCTATSQCATGEVCDGSTGVCIADPSTQPVCSATTACPSGEQCLADGFCHYPCTTEAQCIVIDGRFVACSGGFCRTAVENNPGCTLDNPCPSGKACISNKCQ